MTDGIFHDSSIIDSLLITSVDDDDVERKTKIEPIENKTFSSLADVHWIGFFLLLLIICRLILPNSISVDVFDHLTRNIDVYMWHHP